jgi:hypothetical protein
MPACCHCPCACTAIAVQRRATAAAANKQSSNRLRTGNGMNGGKVDEWNGMGQQHQSGWLLCRALGDQKLRKKNRERVQFCSVTCHTSHTCQMCHAACDSSHDDPTQHAAQRSAACQRAFPLLLQHPAPIKASAASASAAAQRSRSNAAEEAESAAAR